MLNTKDQKGKLQYAGVRGQFRMSYEG